jgi:hypothetical protein
MKRTLLVMLAALLLAGVASARTPLGLLRALESLPVYHLDRGPEQADLKAAQLLSAASAINEAAQGDRDLAALLVTVGFHESAWSMAIMNGQCGKYECDRDRHGNVRAVSNFQLWRVSTSSPEAWELAKTDVRVASREAARALKRARGLCKGEPDMVRATLRAYAGRGCRKRLKDEEARVRTYLRVKGTI